MKFSCSITFLFYVASCFFCHVAEAKDDLPILKDGLHSKTYEVHFITDPYRAQITYHPQDRFFIIGKDNFRKFDARGRQAYHLSYSDDNYRISFMPYVVTPNGIYDFSQTRLHKQSFVQVIDGKPGYKIKREDFLEAFIGAYADADVVVYGNYNFDIRKYPAFMQIKGKWILFYLSSDNIEIEQDFEFGTTVKGFPTKGQRMILLRDPKQQRYSHDSREIREGIVRVPEDRLKYSTKNKLDRLSYKSSYVSENYTYTSIPAQKAGYGIYQLAIDGEVMDFKEIATRKAFSFKVISHLSLFNLPKKHADKVPVSFLEFNPLNNIDTSGSDGLYVVRPRD